MKCAEEYMRLYAVTDRAWVGGQTLYQQVESALKGGVTCVQLREKELDEEAFLKEAFELHDLCKKYNVPFFINDNVDVLPEGMMKAICDAVDIPVVAIGGIHKENLLQLKGTGVNGVALVSAIFGAEDIEAECRELKALAEQL